MMRNCERGPELDIRLAPVQTRSAKSSRPPQIAPRPQQPRQLWLTTNEDFSGDFSCYALSAHERVRSIGRVSFHAAAFTLLILALPSLAQAQSLREQGQAAAIQAAQADAIQYQPCQEIDVGLCMKLPPTRWERAATWAIAYYGVCAFADIGSTLFGTGKGVLVERNPILKPLEQEPIPMAIAKGSMTAGITWLFTQLRKKTPVLTALSAAGLGSFQCWAAGNNHRETRR